jgi:hypothetical protein
MILGSLMQGANIPCQHINVHHQLDLANMMFAGLWLLPFGLLVYGSCFLPRFLAVWLTADCFPYLALSVSGSLLPGSEEKIFSQGNLSCGERRPQCCGW